MERENAIYTHSIQNMLHLPQKMSFYSKKKRLSAKILKKYKKPLAFSHIIDYNNSCVEKTEQKRD